MGVEIFGVATPTEHKALAPPFSLFSLDICVKPVNGMQIIAGNTGQTRQMSLDRHPRLSLPHPTSNPVVPLRKLDLGRRSPSFDTIAVEVDESVLSHTKTSVLDTCINSIYIAPTHRI